LQMVSHDLAVLRALVLFRICCKFLKNVSRKCHMTFNRPQVTFQLNGIMLVQRSGT